MSVPTKECAKVAVMKPISPKPIIARVVRTWCIPPGLTFALVEDVERQFWVVESCPVGTHFWTVAQAAQLPRGARTRRVLEEVIRAGQRLAQTREGGQEAALPRSISRETRGPGASVSDALSTNAGRAHKVLRQRPKTQAARSVSTTLAGV
jgi:hypothetical protein